MLRMPVQAAVARGRTFGHAGSAAAAAPLEYGRQSLPYANL
jgi:hypothetical protein